MSSYCAFASLLTELGLHDVWQVRHAADQCYSCYSATHGGLSHIDLELGNGMLMQRVRDLAYEPRLLSDHCPFWVWLDATASLGRPLWRGNPFWLTLFLLSDGIPGTLREFLTFNKTLCQCSSDERLKAFLRGCLIREIRGIKNRSREWEDRVQNEMQSR